MALQGLLLISYFCFNADNGDDSYSLFLSKSCFLQKKTVNSMHFLSFPILLVVSLYYVTQCNFYYACNCSKYTNIINTKTSF